MSTGGGQAARWLVAGCVGRSFFFCFFSFLIVRELKSAMRVSKAQRRAEQVDRKNIQEAATVMALNLATSIIERAGLGGEVTGANALGIYQEKQEKVTCENA